VNNLRFERDDSNQYYYPMREAYLDFRWDFLGSNLLRVGKQQVVWGKAGKDTATLDAFFDDLGTDDIAIERHRAIQAGHGEMGLEQPRHRDRRDHLRVMIAGTAGGQVRPRSSCAPASTPLRCAAEPMSVSGRGTSSDGRRRVDGPAHEAGRSDRPSPGTGRQRRCHPAARRRQPHRRPPRVPATHGDGMKQR